MGELKKPGVTKKLLWEEYVKECHIMGKQLPYQYTQFCTHLMVGLNSLKPRCISSIRQVKKVEVDLAGKTYQVINSDTGEVKKCISLFPRCHTVS